IPRCNICVSTLPETFRVSGRKYAFPVAVSSTSRRSIFPSGAATSFTVLNLYWYGTPRTGPIKFCSLPHDDVISATASFRRRNRSRNLIIVLCRRPNNGCDLGNGGGACV